MTLWTPSTHLRRLPYLGLMLASGFVMGCAQEIIDNPKLLALDSTGKALCWLALFATGALQTRWQWLRWQDAALKDWIFWTAVFAAFAFQFVGGFTNNPGYNTIGSIAGFVVGLPCLLFPSNDREARLVGTFE